MNLELEFESAAISHIFGPFDTYVRTIEKIFHVIIVDRDGKIVMTTRLYNEKEFQKLVGKIDSLLKGNQK